MAMKLCLLALLALSLAQFVVADVVAVLRIMQPILAINYNSQGITEFQANFVTDAAEALKVPESRFWEYHVCGTLPHQECAAVLQAQGALYSGGVRRSGGVPWE